MLLNFFVTRINLQLRIAAFCYQTTYRLSYWFAIVLVVLPAVITALQNLSENLLFRLVGIRILDFTAGTSVSGAAFPGIRNSDSGRAISCLLIIAIDTIRMPICILLVFSTSTQSLL